MISVKKHISALCESVFLIVLFFASQLPLRDFDIWFHIKSGELFVTQGHLQLTEVFSFAAYGREWTTFEWLFQVASYYASRIGLWIIPPLISVWVVMGFFFLFRILDRICHVPLIGRLLIAFAFWVSTYEFNTARPHTIAYTFLIIHLYLILSRISLNKRWIWISPLLTLIWSNIHSTGFLAWGFLLAFGLSLIIQWLLTKKYEYLSMGRELLILAVINAAVTLLPPMGLADYRLLWRFFVRREFLGHFISEWGPPADNPFGYRIYIYTFISTVAIYILTSVRNKKIIPNLIGLPFLVMAIGGFTATRNIYLGTLGLVLLLGISLQQMAHLISIKYRFWVSCLLIIVSLGFYTWVFSLKYQNVYTNRLYYPLQATEFIKSRKLRGNMFNDYNYGAYMLYRLYPDQHVFIDGRADVYECCEMRDYLNLAVNKRMDDTEYRRFLTTVWDKYDISYAVIVTTKHNIMRRIATLLNTDPQWALVFWDDDSQIFVRRDGKNDTVLTELETNAATPYLRNPYKSGMETEAMTEYMRMDALAKSARTSNAIGYLYLKQQRFAEAKTRFEEAKLLDPTFESPYMNLAELSVRDGNIPEAIRLYFKANRLAPDRGLIYIRLGELTLKQTGDRAKALKIWSDGLGNTVDDDAKKRLQGLVANQ